MKKRFAEILMALLLMTITGSCTRNNGDIGDYFGEWRLERLTADGEEVALYTEKSGVELYTWGFQGRLIQIVEILPRHEYIEHTGSWREDGDILELNFGYSDNEPGHLPGYRAPEALHLVCDGITRLHIDRFKHRRMVLSYVSDKGVLYTYYLKRPV